MFAPGEIFLTTEEIRENLAYFPRIDFTPLSPAYGAVRGLAPMPCRHGVVPPEGGGEGEGMRVTMESNALLKTKLALGHVNEQGLKPLAYILNEPPL